MAEKETVQRPKTPNDVNATYEKHPDREHHAGLRDGGLSNDILSVDIGESDDEVFSMTEVDPVLEAKMRLVNRV